MEKKPSLRSFIIPAIENEQLHVIKEGEVINLFCGTNDPNNSNECRDTIWEYISKIDYKFECITYFDFENETEFDGRKWSVTDYDFEKHIYLKYNVYTNDSVKPSQRLIKGNINDYEQIYWLSIKKKQ